MVKAWIVTCVKTNQFINKKVIYNNFDADKFSLILNWNMLTIRVLLYTENPSKVLKY